MDYRSVAFWTIAVTMAVLASLLNFTTFCTTGSALLFTQPLVFVPLVVGTFLVAPVDAKARDWATVANVMGIALIMASLLLWEALLTTSASLPPLLSFQFALSVSAFGVALLSLIHLHLDRKPFTMGSVA
jgi:hypothetical protein